MDDRRRKIFPIKDWNRFLQDARKEFYYLFGIINTYKYRKENFEFIRTLGKGAFGHVYLAYLPLKKSSYAIKVLQKTKVVQNKQVKHVINEKKILQALNFPFSVYLEYSFQDNSYLYLCLPFVSGGEMFVHLRTMKRFREPIAKFFAAQVLLVFEYLHYCDAIFRDLKPENILISHSGYLKVTDFGFCKIVPSRTYSLCGTPDYLAPEIILQKGYGKSVDWWTFGVLLFEMAAGYTPFRASEPIKLYEKTVTGKYYAPRFFSENLADLIGNLLQVDVTKRYGMLKNGINDIKYHPWFKHVNWLALMNGEIKPPYVPEIKGEDLANLDLNEEIDLSDSKVDEFEEHFKDF